MGSRAFVVTEKRKDTKKNITLRIPKDTLEAVDKLAAELNYSRTELINMFISYAMDHLEIESEEE